MTKVVDAKSGKTVVETIPLMVAEPVARANSFVGTEEYLAPEIIVGSGHSAPVDWWSFGILIHELVYGVTPFRGHRRDDTFENIVNAPLRFPDRPQISDECKDLITKLLVKVGVLVCVWALAWNAGFLLPGRVWSVGHWFAQGKKCSGPDELDDFIEQAALIASQNQPVSPSCHHPHASTHQACGCNLPAHPATRAA